MQTFEPYNFHANYLLDDPDKGVYMEVVVDREGDDIPFTATFEGSDWFLGEGDSPDAAIEDLVDRTYKWARGMHWLVFPATAGDTT